MVNIDRSIVSQNFSAAARNYDRWAKPQLEIAKLLRELAPSGAAPERILDVGCGAGFLTRLLRERYPESQIHGIDLAPGMIELCRERFQHDARMDFSIADAMSWDPDAAYDLTAASCCVQWLGDPADWLPRFRAWLRPDGAMLVSILLPGTFRELRASYSAVCGETLTGPELFPEEYHHEAWDAIALKCIEAKRETHVFFYPSARDVLAYFKKIGVAMSRHPGNSPLPYGRIKRLLEYYTTHFTDAAGNAACTYDVLYALLEKPS
ncbi:methyltransferase domain-containing protein [Candidatus Sumerlaeota bacterium]|nr:methyltransferase domain-containing protein [Candidatus Sumerlaeota bacterium]